MTGRLQDKVAIITGAGCVGPGWGNGRAACVRFAEEGAKIFAVDMKPETMEETLARTRDAIASTGGAVEPYLCDVTDRARVEAMVAACIDRFGKVDILVNNVGGSAKGGAVELSEEDWDRQMEFNLKSVYLTCRSVLPHMAGQGAGAIVNTSSTSGLRWTGAAQAAYASSKAAVIQFGKVTAVEYAARGVRVNTVVPGQLHGLVAVVELDVVRPVAVGAADFARVPLALALVVGLDLVAARKLILGRGVGPGIVA